MILSFVHVVMLGNTYKITEEACTDTKNGEHALLFFSRARSSRATTASDMRSMRRAERKCTTGTRRAACRSWRG